MNTKNENVVIIQADDSSWHYRPWGNYTWQDFMLTGERRTNPKLRAKGRFNNMRYVTRGLDRSVPHETIQHMWDIIDGMTIRKEDMQFFSLFEHEGKQRIVHNQSARKKFVHDFETDHIITTNVMAQDTGYCSVMFLSEEY